MATYTRKKSVVDIMTYNELKLYIRAYGEHAFEDGGRYILKSWSRFPKYDLILKYDGIIILRYDDRIDYEMTCDNIITITEDNKLEFYTTEQFLNEFTLVGETDKFPEIVCAPTGCGKHEFWEYWSVYSKNNTWNRKNDGKVALNDYGQPIGEKIGYFNYMDYKYIEQEDGSLKRNYNYPYNLIYIMRYLNMGDSVILVNSAKELRDAMKEFRIPYHLICPTNEVSYRMSLEDKKADPRFIEYIDSNWDDFSRSLVTDEYAFKHSLSESKIDQSIMISIENLSEG